MDRRMFLTISAMLLAGVKLPRPSTPVSILGASPYANASLQYEITAKTTDAAYVYFRNAVANRISDMVDEHYIMGEI